MLAITIIVMLAIAVFAILKPSKQEKQAAAEREESLKDEQIYNSITGRYLTLEEAENEIINADDYINRIKSDEEIKKHFLPEEQEVEYIIRDMIQLGIAETEDERINELLEFSKIFESEIYSVNNLWEIKPDHFLGIAYVTYKYPGSNQIRDYEYHLIGIVQGNLLNTESEAYAEIEFAEISETQIFKIPKKISHSKFKKMKDLILSHT